MPRTKKQATQKQVTALKLIQEGMTPRQAMLKAGYSESSANNPKNILYKAQGVQSLVERFHMDLHQEGITTAYMAKKFKEWLGASKPTSIRIGTTETGKPTFDIIDTPDYMAQIQAGKMIMDTFNIKANKKDNENISRRVTLEEFING